MGVRATLLSLLAVGPAVAGFSAPAAKPADVHPVAVLTVTPTEAAATTRTPASSVPGTRPTSGSAWPARSPPGSSRSVSG